MLKRAIVIAIFIFTVTPQNSFAASINIPSPADIIIGAQNFTSNIFGWLNVVKQATPYATRYIPKVDAQVSGNGDALVIYFSEVNGVIGPNASCPATGGWTESFYGYGPHYLGLLSYYPIAANGKPMGWAPGQPTFPLPPPPPGPNPQSPPPTGPQTGNGPDQPEPKDPPPPPEPAGPITPSGEPNPPDNSPPNPVPTEEPDKVRDLPNPNINSLPFKNIYAELFNIPNAIAQTIPPTYVLDDVAIASDSLCSIDQYVVVPIVTSYNNTMYTPSSAAYAKACATNPNTGIVTCNRCKVCRK